MATTRRMGPKGSDVWHTMLDAAETILAEEGYGALTSRHVAERSGVKQRLIYYYFQTMDELIVETFRRLKARDMDRITHALASRHSLREVWDVCVHTTDTRMVQEFMALANRVEPLRNEVVEYIEAARRLHIEALEKAMQPGAAKLPVSPAAAAIFATSAALAVHREAGIGISTGHADVMAVIERFLEQLDPEG